MAGETSPEKLWATKRKILIKELMEGRDITTQLQNLLSLDNPLGVEQLLVKISRSFSESISVLNSCVKIHGSDVFHVGPTSSSQQDSGESVNRSPPVKGRRGCYKRRKTIDSRRLVSSKTEDGYSWRKYGQKGILNSKFPRCYFRCTYKHDQGCQALKQVQQLENESNTFSITYIGHHTCKKSTDIIKPTHISDSDSAFQAFTMDGFEPKAFPLSQIEHNEETASDDQLFDDHLLDSAISWQDDVMPLKSANNPPMFLSSEMKTDESEDYVDSGVGYLCGSPSSYGMDVDMEMRLMKSIEFDNWDFHC